LNFDFGFFIKFKNNGSGEIFLILAIYFCY